MGYEEFEHLCKTRGVTPYRVAKETGVTTSTLSSWKSGRYTPKTEKLKILADYFGVGVEYLQDVQTDEQPKYYIDDETLEIAELIFKRKGLRVLFDAAQDVSEEDLRLVYDLLLRMKNTNKDE